MSEASFDMVLQELRDAAPRAPERLCANACGHFASLRPSEGSSFDPRSSRIRDSVVPRSRRDRRL